MKFGARPSAEDNLPTRQSLLQRLKNWGDGASWDDFARTYSRFMRGIAFKSGLNESEADDVVQETMLAVAKNIPTFEYDPNVGSFKSWLALIARRRIADHLRKKHFHAGGVRQPREELAGSTVIANLPAPDSHLEEQYDAEWSQSVLETASAKVKERVRNMEYQMFHLHVVKQLPVTEVVKLLGVKAAQVYFAKYKVGRMMRQEIKRLERQLL
jgi:RNA polymerase sigma factor (sigma-70 family)